MAVAVRVSATIRRPTLQHAQQDDHSQRDDQEHGRHGGSTGQVVVLDLPEHPNRRDFGPPRQAAGNQHHRAEFAKSAGKGQRRTRRHRRCDVGQIKRTKIVNLLAPREAPASSTSRSSSSSTGWTARTTNGNVTKTSATRIDYLVWARVMPRGLLLPYKAISTSPATMVGKANGTSMTRLNSCRPMKRSRTSTHATKVPSTVLTAVAAAAIVTVNRIEAATAGLVMVSTNSAKPLLIDVRRTAANGRITRMLIQSRTSPSARPELRPRRRTPSGGAVFLPFGPPADTTADGPRGGEPREPAGAAT